MSANRLEQDAFAFHDRLAGQCADIAQAEHGGSVGDHRDQVAFGRVLISVLRILLDFKTGIGYARAYRQDLDRAG